MSNSNEITAEYIEMLLNESAAARIPRENCFIYELLVFEYAEKSLVGKSDLTPYQERKVKEHIDGCPHCFYNYLEAQKILREEISEKDLLLIKSKISKNKIRAEEHSFVDQAKRLLIKTKAVGSRLCIDGLELLASPTREFATVRSGVTEEVIHHFLVPGAPVQIHLDERSMILNSELLIHWHITVMHQTPSGERMEIGRWIVGPENGEVLHWRAPELPGEHMIEIYITRDEPPTTGTDIKKFQEWIESREDNDKVSFKKAVQVRFC